MTTSEWTPLHGHALAVRVDCGQLVCAPMGACGEVDDGAAFEFMASARHPIVGEIKSLLGNTHTWIDFAKRGGGPLRPHMHGMDGPDYRAIELVAGGDDLDNVVRELRHADWLSVRTIAAQQEFELDEKPNPVGRPPTHRRRK